MDKLDKIRLGVLKWIKFNEEAEEIFAGLGLDLKEDLARIDKKINTPMNILVAGEFNAGKSTFINALLGRQILVSDITPATSVITKITYGDTQKLLVHYKNKSVKKIDNSALKELTAEGDQVAHDNQREISYVELQLPIEILKLYNLIDSPGVTSLHQNHTSATESYLHEADAAIWLFNSMNVGTSSEINWLKKLYNRKIPIYGLVNGIDRLDEEENLESFYEYNERRLQPYITWLDGISAKDILDGKLVEDMELLEWGNVKAIENLFEVFYNKKLVQCYLEIKSPLHLLHETYFQNNDLQMYADLRCGLITGLQEKQKLILKTEKELFEIQNALHVRYEKWKPYLGLDNKTNLDVQNFIELEGLTENIRANWSNEINSLVLDVELRSNEIKREIRKLEQSKLLLDRSFEKIETVFLRLLQTIRYFRDEKKYNDKVEGLRINLTLLKVDYEQLNMQLRKLKKEVDIYIQKDFEADEDKYLEIKREWKKSLVSVEQFHKPWSIKKVQDMEAYFFIFKQYQLNVLPAFLIAESKEDEFETLEEVVSTIENINRFNSTYRESEEINFYLDKVKQTFDVQIIPPINAGIKPEVGNIEKWKVPAIRKKKKNQLLKLGPHVLKEPIIVTVIFVIATIIF